MKVLLTGATGFTGTEVLSHLLSRGIAVRCYVRSKEKGALLRDSGVDVFIGDLADSERLTSAARGCDLLLNIASIGFGHAETIVRSVEAGGIRRAVFVSTTAIFTQLNAASKVVRIEAENTIKSSGLDWTIVRPTMIYGTSRDRNIWRLIRYIGRFPVLPVFGSGEYLLQPVYVKDLAYAIVEAGMTRATVRREYNLAGGQPLTFNMLVNTVCGALDKKVWLLHIPHRPVVWFLSWLERLRIRLPIKAEQILRLNEHKAFPWSDARKDFGYTPCTFECGLRQEIEEYKYNHK